MFKPTTFDDSSSGYGSCSSTSSIHPVFLKPSSLSSRDISHLSPIKRLILDNPARMKYLNQSMITILDQLDSRVAFLRETAIELEDEKRKLLSTLNSFKLADDLNNLPKVDLEEIKVTTDHLLNRLQMVDVSVTTPRNQDQIECFTRIEKLIENIINMKNENEIEKATNLCRLYLNSCSTDLNSENQLIDDKFQAILISCTADDQKRTRKKLETLLVTLSNSH